MTAGLVGPTAPVAAFTPVWFAVSLTRYGLLTVAALIAFGMYGTWKMTQPPNRPTGGLECSSSKLTLPLSHAWVYLLAVGTALVIAGLVSFRRRDVA